METVLQGETSKKLYYFIILHSIRFIQVNLKSLFHLRAITFDNDSSLFTFFYLEFHCRV